MHKSRWRWCLLLVTLIALFIVLSPLLFGNPPMNSGDVNVYRAEMELFFDGQIPYLEFRFEHLPLAILPMAIAHLVSLVTGVSFVYPFMAISLAMVIAIGWLVVRVGDRLGIEEAGLRWVVISAPMLLLIPFRIDALSVLLAIASVSLAIERRYGSSLVAATAGILAKGWPVVLAAPEWWRGERRRARWLVAMTAVFGLALIAMPGFRAARSYVGVHQETLSGSVVILGRLLTGQDPQIVHSAGAEYVAVGGWATVLNLLVGAAVGVTALAVLRRAFSWLGGIALSSALVYAVLLASPLLSAQFLLWPMPFVALVGTRRERLLLTATAAVSVALVAVWSPEELWWHGGWLARNAMLVVAAALAVGNARTIATAETELVEAA